jgi:N-methylhydantoinase B/oxoprolinase/acetone carboxylase alpha subunit
MQSSYKYSNLRYSIEFDWLLSLYVKCYPFESEGDFAAQISANRSGLTRLGQLIDEWGRDKFLTEFEALN